MLAEGAWQLGYQSDAWCNHPGAILGYSSGRVSCGSPQGYLLGRGNDLKPALANKGVSKV